MTQLRILLDGDGCWPDLQGKVGTPHVWHVTEGVEIARLRAGMSSGKTSATIRIPLPDGRVLLTEISLDMLELTVKAFRAAEEREAMANEANDKSTVS